MERVTDGESYDDDDNDDENLFKHGAFTIS